MIHQLADPAAAAPLFSGWDETLILSSLSGMMGAVWMDDDMPDSAMCILGDFAFYTGRPSENLLRFSPEAGPRFMILTPRDPAWEAAIQNVYTGKCQRGIRYAFDRSKARFDRQQLEALAGALPMGYRLQDIDGLLYDECRKLDFTWDFVSQFQDKADYLTRGLGVAALWGDTLVGGASSYSVFPGGIEIEIDIQEEHRRKGLASACAAQLILRCLDKGLTPSWDAANMISVQLAQKLGFDSPREYPVYFTDFFGHP
ncbi:MAG: GNAT family N-acetyltransferase [Clostridia bacterium]|nr:GNAT family N-acetyltransferase [Clostridia bacterium]